MSKQSLDEAVDILEKAVDILESSSFVYKKFQGEHLSLDLLGMTSTWIRGKLPLAIKLMT